MSEFSIIYKIVCKNPLIREIYCGSTKNTLRTRWSAHKSTYNKNGQQKLYKFMRENGGIDNFTIRELEIIPYTTKNAQLEKEKFWKNFLQATLNNNSPIGLDIERHSKNVQKAMKKYYLKNHAKFLEYGKQYRERMRQAQA